MRIPLEWLRELVVVSGAPDLRVGRRVPIAQVGVVIAYVGAEGKDVSGDAFKHGNLVSKGQRGVWAEPLDPGKYPINPYTHKVELVPTANVVLNWAVGKTESHKLDEKLSTSISPLCLSSWLSPAMLSMRRK